MNRPLITLEIRWNGERAEFELGVVGRYPPRLRIEPGRVVVLDDYTRIESMAINEWSPNGAEPIVERFFHSVLDANDGTFPPGAGRIVLDMPLRLAARSWESILGEKIDLTNAAFLRRVSSGWRPRSPLSFPFGVALTTDEDRVGMDMYDSIFDEYVRERLPSGVVTIAPPESAVIWHHVADVLETPTWLLRTFPAPRLLVLQRSKRSRSYLTWIEWAVERGVSAVVVIAGPKESASAFVRSFYRKLFHNEPLERCAAIAIQESKVPQDAVMLFARPGGELDLLLTLVPIEMAVMRGPFLSLEAAAKGWPESTRRERSTREILTPAATALRDRHSRAISEAMQYLHSLEFTGEEHDVHEVKRVSDTLAASFVEDDLLLEQAGKAAVTVRYTNLTLQDSVGRPCRKDQSLVPGHEYALHVQIAPVSEAAQVSTAFDETKLRELFDQEELIALDVVVFAPTDEFFVGETRRTIWLSRVGSSTTAVFAVTPQRSGWCRLRVAVYRGNNLIQSVALQAYASNEVAPADAIPTITKALDWAASTDLLLLDELAMPVISIFTNDAPDGSHWIGVFDGDEEAPATLRAGQMRKFDSQDLTSRTKDLRDALQSAHGLDSYRYPADSSPGSPTVVQFGIETLIDLAVSGRKAFSYLFESMTDISPQRLKKLGNAIGKQQSGTISIARVDGRWTLPWSALYDFPLDVTRPLDLNVCSLFLNQLAANEWDESGQNVRTVNDLLSDPVACRAQTNCPLKGRNANVTICPFGFWGFRNQIEEPLGQVTPTGEDDIPKEMKRASFSQTRLIPCTYAKELRVAAGVFPFDHLYDHEHELETLLGKCLSWETDREKVIKLLYDQHGHHIFYFYCHGRAGSEFEIEVGPANAIHNRISAASLELGRFHWAEDGNPQPLVILIACESAAARPETMHGLIGFLRNAMASGVVGSEITIDTGLGRLWGYRFISSLVQGTSVGESFLQLRQELLRRYNPLGLGFSVYAPAALHICDDPDGGGRCARYH